MKTLLKLEELAIFILCLLLFFQLDFAWWWFAVLFFLPDIGILGYFINPKIGGFIYNFFHLRIVAAIVAIYATTYGDENWKLAAVILFAHISFDRMLGFGLKHNNSFYNTHLGNIDKKKPLEN